MNIFFELRSVPYLSQVLSSDSSVEMGREDSVDSSYDTGSPENALRMNNPVFPLTSTLFFNNRTSLQ